MSNQKLFFPHTIRTPINDYFNLANQNKVNHYNKPESVISFHQIKNQLNNDYNYINSSQIYNFNDEKNQERGHCISNSGDFLNNNYKQYNFFNSQFMYLKNSINELNKKIKEKDNIILSLERQLDLISAKNNNEKSKSLPNKRDDNKNSGKYLNNIKEEEKTINNKNNIQLNLKNENVNYRKGKNKTISNSSILYVDKNLEKNQKIKPFYISINRNDNLTNNNIIIDNKNYKIQTNINSFRGNNKISLNSRINETIQQGKKIGNNNENSNQIYKNFNPISLSYKYNRDEFFKNLYGSKIYESNIINNIFKQYMKKRDEINNSKNAIKNIILNGNEKDKNEKSLTIDELKKKRNKEKFLKKSLSHNKKHRIIENEKFTSNLNLTKSPLNLKSNFGNAKNNNDNKKDKENHNCKSNNKNNKEINNMSKNKSNIKSISKKEKNNKAKTPNSRTLKEKKSNQKLIRPKTYKTLELMKYQLMNELNLKKNIENKKIVDKKEKNKNNIDSFNNIRLINDNILKEEKKSLYQLNNDKNHSGNSQKNKNNQSKITDNIPSIFDSLENHKKEKQNIYKDEGIINLQYQSCDKIKEIKINEDNFNNDNDNIINNVNTNNNIMIENSKIIIKKKNINSNDNLKNNQLIKQNQNENKYFNKLKLELKENKELKINKNENNKIKTNKKLDDSYENIQNPQIKIEENNSEESSIELDVEPKYYLTNNINNPIFNFDEELLIQRKLKKDKNNQQIRIEQNKDNTESKGDYLKNNSNNKIGNESFISLSNSNIILTCKTQKEFNRKNEKKLSSITLVDQKNSEFMSEKTLNEIQLTVNDLETPTPDKFNYLKKQNDIFYNKIYLTMSPKKNIYNPGNEQFFNEKCENNKNNSFNIQKYSINKKRIQNSNDEKIISKSYDDYKYPLNDIKFDYNDKNIEYFTKEKKLSSLGYFKYNIIYNFNEVIKFSLSSSNITKYFSDIYLYSIFDEKRIIVFNKITKTFLINEFIDLSNSKFKQNYISNGSLLLNTNDSLYIVTGNNFDMLYKYDPYKNIMRLLGKFKNNHIYGGLLINSNIIYCLTGNFNNKVEQFNIKEKKVIENKENMKVERSEASYIILNKKYIFSFFGFNVNENKYINSIEFTELNSNMNWEFINILNNINNCILELKGHCIINYNKNNHFLILGGYNGEKNPNEYIIKCEININDIQICILNLEKKFETLINKKAFLFSYFYENDNLSNEKYIFDRKNNIHYFNTTQIKRDIFYLE